MRFFRINIYLTIKYFFFSLFSSHKKITNKINKYLKFYSNKNEIILTSQLRVGFKLVLNYLKEKNPNCMNLQLFHFFLDFSPLNNLKLI